MHRSVTCECGFQVSAPDEGSLVDAARHHAEVVHGITASAELVLAMAQPVPATEEADR